jgi:allophanate hydrolase subunit 2
MFLGSDWKLSAKSDRTGFRLDGPQWTFSEKATNKGPEHGSEPSNIIDQGYPGGGINLAGQTPIILVNDGPSMGGFINPYTVPSSVFWKLGQSKPGDIYRFKAISVDESQEMSRHLNQLCSEASIC